VYLFCNMSKGILLFFSYISSLLLLFFWRPLLTGPKAKGSNSTTGLTLLWARNPSRGNFNHWQVSRNKNSNVGNPTQRRLHNDYRRFGESYSTRGSDESLARPTYRCILFDGENISFDTSFVIFI